jgi:hypothetical protein
VFRRACHWILSWASWIHSITSLNKPQNNRTFNISPMNELLWSSVHPYWLLKYWALKQGPSWGHCKEQTTIAPPPFCSYFRVLYKYALNLNTLFIKCICYYSFHVHICLFRTNWWIRINTGMNMMPRVSLPPSYFSTPYRLKYKYGEHANICGGKCAVNFVC